MFRGFMKKKSGLDLQNQDRGILVFENTTEVIRAEKVLKKEGRNVKVKGPPPDGDSFRLDRLRYGSGIFGCSGSQS